MSTKNPRRCARLRCLRRQCRSWRAGLSLVEAVIAMVVVSGLFIAALTAVGASRTGQQSLEDSVRGYALAQDLLSEILAQSYQEPDGTASMGLETGELSTSSRSAFDDVDDYHNWSASPPRHRDGTQVEGFDGWTRSVEVVRVRLGNLNGSSSSETGIKRITVTVQHGPRIVAQLTALRTSAWPDLERRRGGP